MSIAAAPQSLPLIYSYLNHNPALSLPLRRRGRRIYTGVPDDGSHPGHALASASRRSVRLTRKGVPDDGS